MCCKFQTLHGVDGGMLRVILDQIQGLLGRSSGLGGQQNGSCPPTISVISDDSLYFAPYMSGDMDIHLVHEMSMAQVAELVLEHKLNLRHDQIVVHVGAHHVFTQLRAQVIDGCVKLINALGMKFPQARILVSLLLPRMANVDVAHPYVDAHNAALKTTVKVAQRRFQVRFLDLYAHFVTNGRPDTSFFTYSAIQESDDELDKSFKLQDQIADPMGIRLSQQGVVTWRMKAAQVFNNDPLFPTLPNP